jgi:hypothetical protein
MFAAPANLVFARKPGEIRVAHDGNEERAPSVSTGTALKSQC